MNKSQPSQYETVKNKIIKGRCTVEDLRGEIRKEFKRKMHSLRNEQVDARRRSLLLLLTENSIADVIRDGFDEIRSNLLSDAEPALDVDAVFAVLSDVKEELLREELETYERDVRQETNAIVENLLDVCCVCESFVDERCGTANVVCRNCARAHFDDVNLY